MIFWPSMNAEFSPLAGEYFSNVGDAPTTQKILLFTTESTEDTEKQIIFFSVSSVVYFFLFFMTGFHE